MQCTECKADSPEGKTYCGDCGALLGKTLEETTKENFRDRQALEIGITEAVFEKLTKWVKWLGIFTAIPLGLLVAVLTLLGLRSYSDITKVMDVGKAEILAIVASAKKDLPNSVESARRDVADLQAKVAGLKKEYESIESDLHNYQRVNQRISKLQGDLQTVQGQIARWYEAMRVETFDAKNWNQLHFTKVPAKGSTPEHWVVEITLEHRPIPASLRIIRHAYSVQPNLIEIRGNKVSFITFDDKQETPDDTITIQYHPLPE
jgi:hypothetical protein